MRVNTPAAWGALVTNLECHNFSTSFTCTTAHISLLANGVKFVPTPGTMSTSELWREAVKFENTVRRLTRFDDSIFVGVNDHDVNNNNGSDTSTMRKSMPALFRPTGMVQEPLPETTPLFRQTNAFLERFKMQISALGQERLCDRNWLR